MGDASAIEWTDATWNPIVGCSRVSPGCENCYAERQVHRGLHESHRGLTVLRQGRPGWKGEVRLVAERLAMPLRWKRPRRIFVNSLSDLFHEELAFEAIAAVFGVMAAAPQHTFQVLTKRPERARDFFAWLARRADEECITEIELAVICAYSARGVVMQHAEHAEAFRLRELPIALPNVWLGVTAEDQQRADERIPVLLDTPAAVRWVSYEPALGPIDFRQWLAPWWCPEHGEVLGDEVRVDVTGTTRMHEDVERVGYCGRIVDPADARLDWIVVGGESGPRARPFDVAWAYSTVGQCRAAGVPCFVKQLGAHPIDATQEDAIGPDGRVHWVRPAGHELLAEVAQRPGYSITPHRLRLKDRKGADEWEWDRMLWVKQWPRVRS